MMFGDDMMLGTKTAVLPPAYVDSTLKWASSGTSRVINAPVGMASGDFLFAACWSVNASDVWTGPAGFSPAIATLTGSNASVALFSKVATGSEPGTYTFTGSNSADHFIFLFAYRNATSATANNLAGASIGTVDPQVAASMSVSAGRVLLAICGLWNNGVTLTTGPSGMTSREQQFSTALPRGAAFEETVLASGASGTRSFDISGPVSGAAFLVEIG